MRYGYDMKIKQMEVDAMKAKEQMIEDRKDNRTRLEATQQSEMISQRENKGLPLNFQQAFNTVQENTEDNQGGLPQ